MVEPDSWLLTLPPRCAEKSSESFRLTATARLDHKYGVSRVRSGLEDGVNCVDKLLIFAPKPSVAPPQGADKHAQSPQLRFQSGVLPKYIEDVVISRGSPRFSDTRVTWRTHHCTPSRNPLVADGVHRLDPVLLRKLFERIFPCATLTRSFRHNLPQPLNVFRQPNSLLHPLHPRDEVIS